MTKLDLTQMLQEEWARELGFFGRLRDGHFDQEGHRRVAELLGASLIADEVLLREFVAVTWYIPIFMCWQRERCMERGANASEYDRAANQLTALVEKLLGVP